MHKDGERSDAFFEGIGQIPKRDRYANDYSDHDPQTDFMKVIKEQVKELREGDVYTGTALYREATKPIQESAGTERCYEVTYNWAFDNGARKEIVQCLYAVAETVQEGKKKLNDLLLNKYPNCFVTCIEHKED